MNAPSRYKALQPNTRFSGRVERQRGEGEQSRANEAVGSAEDHGPHRPLRRRLAHERHHVP